MVTHCYTSCFINLPGSIQREQLDSLLKHRLKAQREGERDLSLKRTDIQHNIKSDTFTAVFVKHL